MAAVCFLAAFALTPRSVTASSSSDDAAQGLMFDEYLNQNKNYINLTVTYLDAYKNLDELPKSARCGTLKPINFNYEENDGVAKCFQNSSTGGCYKKKQVVVGWETCTMNGFQDVWEYFVRGMVDNNVNIRAPLLQSDDPDEIFASLGRDLKAVMCNQIYLYALDPSACTKPEDASSGECSAFNLIGQIKPKEFERAIDYVQNRLTDGMALTCSNGNRCSFLRKISDLLGGASYDSSFQSNQEDSDGLECYDFYQGELFERDTTISAKFFLSVDESTFNSATGVAPPASCSKTRGDGFKDCGENLYVPRLCLTDSNPDKSGGVCVPCPNYDANDNRSKESGYGCKVPNLGYCTESYHCNDGLYCRSRGPGDENVGGICTFEGICNDVLHKNYTVSSCAAESQQAILYFYAASSDDESTKAIPCVASTAFQDTDLDDFLNAPYAKLVLPFDCGNYSKMNAVYNAVMDRLEDGMNLYPENSNVVFRRLSYIEFFEPFCVGVPVKTLGKDKIGEDDLVERVKNFSRFVGLASQVLELSDRGSSPDAGCDNRQNMITAWCVTQATCAPGQTIDNCDTNGRALGGIQIVPGNSLRVTFYPGVYTPSGDTYEMNNVSYWPILQYNQDKNRIAYLQPASPTPDALNIMMKDPNTVFANCKTDANEDGTTIMKCSDDSVVDLANPDPTCGLFTDVAVTDTYDYIFCDGDVTPQNGIKADTAKDCAIACERLPDGAPDFMSYNDDSKECRCCAQIGNGRTATNESYDPCRTDFVGTKPPAPPVDPCKGHRANPEDFTNKRITDKMGGAPFSAFYPWAMYPPFDYFGCKDRIETGASDLSGAISFCRSQVNDSKLQVQLPFYNNDIYAFILEEDGNGFSCCKDIKPMWEAQSGTYGKLLRPFCDFKTQYGVRFLYDLRSEQYGPENSAQVNNNNLYGVLQSAIARGDTQPNNTYYFNVDDNREICDPSNYCDTYNWQDKGMTGNVARQSCYCSFGTDSDHPTEDYLPPTCNAKYFKAGTDEESKPGDPGYNYFPTTGSRTQAPGLYQGNIPITMKYTGSDWDLFTNQKYPSWCGFNGQGSTGGIYVDPSDDSDSWGTVCAPQVLIDYCAEVWPTRSVNPDNNYTAGNQNAFGKAYKLFSDQTDDDSEVIFLPPKNNGNKDVNAKYYKLTGTCSEQSKVDNLKKLAKSWRNVAHLPPDFFGFQFLHEDPNNPAFSGELFNYQYNWTKDYENFRDMSQTAGCAYSRAVFDALKINPVPENIKNSDLFLFLSNTRNDSRFIQQIQRPQSLNPYAMNFLSDIDNIDGRLNDKGQKKLNYPIHSAPTPLTLMFPEFCYMADTSHVQQFFKTTGWKFSQQQTNFIGKIALLQGFAEPNPNIDALLTDAIQEICEPLWNDDFENDVMWKSTITEDDSVDQSVSGINAELSFRAQTEDSAKYHAKDDSDYENKLLPDGYGLPNDQEDQCGDRVSYFMGKILNIFKTLNVVGSVAKQEFGFLGMNQDKFQKGVVLNITAQTPFSYFKAGDLAKNSMCFNLQGSFSDGRQAMGSGLLSVYQAYSISQKTDNTPGENLNDPTGYFFDERRHTGGMECYSHTNVFGELLKKLNTQYTNVDNTVDKFLKGTPSFSGSVAESYGSGPCYCLDEDSDSNPERLPTCTYKISDANENLPAPPSQPTPGPTPTPTPPPTTNAPTSLGQLIQSENDQTTREIGILAAAFFGVVFVLMLAVAVLAFLVQSSKGKTELALDSRYCEKFYREKQERLRNQDKLRRRFEFWKGGNGNSNINGLQY